MVKIPRIYVDAVVVVEEGDHQQCFGHSFDATLTGTTQSPPDDTKADCMCTKKIIGRRAALELREDSVVNLGIGIPEYISRVANEEGIGDYITLTVEADPIGGVPQGGSQFGAALNPECILDQAYQFEFYDGGGVDLAFLGLAQTDEKEILTCPNLDQELQGAVDLSISHKTQRRFTSVVLLLLEG